MIINMRITTKRLTSNYKHKRCKMMTKKIKITTTKMIANNCNQEGGQGRP